MPDDLCDPFTDNVFHLWRSISEQDGCGQPIHGSCSISHLVVRVYNAAAWPLANQFIEARSS
jgi:hypothetical protein